MVFFDFKQSIHLNVSRFAFNVYFKQMALYSIKDLERLSGIKAHTIRIWEHRYGVLQPQRTETNIRRYDDGELKLLLNISQLIRHGGKISKLSKLTPDDLGRQMETLSNSVNKEDDFYSIHIDKLIIAMVELDEAQFEKVIAVTTIKYGFDNTMMKVIIPFLNKVGLMWQIGDINVAQEHFISNLIRRKVIVAIDGLMIPPTNSDKRFILFLPEGELHELGLLFSKYIFKSKGVSTLYLGQTVPLNDLIEAAKVFKPTGIMTFLTSPMHKAQLEAFVSRLQAAFPTEKIFLAGTQVNIHNLPSKGNVVYLNNPTTLADYLK